MPASCVCAFVATASWLLHNVVSLVTNAPALPPALSISGLMTLMSFVFAASTSVESWVILASIWSLFIWASSTGVADDDAVP